MTAEEAPSWATRKGPLLWGLAFSVALAVMIALVLNLQIPRLAKIPLLMLPMLLLIPMVRSVERAQAACGTSSAAMRRYNRRAIVWMFFYVIALFTAIFTHQEWHPTGALGWVIAILPALPLFGFIWSMGAYLVEEQDEYLRQRVTIAALWATGILLAVATGYGFLEMFKLVPHVDSWAAVPVWAIGLAIGNVIVRKTS